MIDIIIKTIYNEIHLSIDSLDDVTEILNQPYVVNYNYKYVSEPSYKKLKHSAIEKNKEVKHYEKRITRKSSRFNS